MATNIWGNADLESGIADWNSGALGGDISWSTTKSNSAVDSGTHSLKVDPTSNVRAGCLSDAVPVSSSTQYTVSWYINPDNAAINYRAEFFDQDNNAVSAVLDNTYTADTWTRVSKTFTTGVDDTGFKLGVRKNNVAGGDLFYIDCVMLETGGSASAWVPGGVQTVIEPPLLTTQISMFNPVVLDSNPTGWDIGPFIYAEAGSGVAVYPPLLQTTIQIHDPVVYAVDVPTAIAPNLMTTQLTMLSPRVSVTTGQSGSKICRFLHLVMGR